MKRSIESLIIISSILIGYLILVKIFHIYIPCIFHKVTKLYCPGCGVTRMLLEILRGNFYQAFRYNQLLFILLPIFIVYFIDYIYSIIKNKNTLVDITPNVVWYTLIVVLLVFGIIRNIFPYFAPTVI